MLRTSPQVWLRLWGTNTVLMKLPPHTRAGFVCKERPRKWSPWISSRPRCHICMALTSSAVWWNGFPFSTPHRHKYTFFHLSVPGGREKCYIHLWPVVVMRLGRARASPRAAIPLPISLCILCSFVYRCVFVCAGMPNPSLGSNTPWTISDRAPVLVTIHIGGWPLEGCWASLTDIKGREEVSPQRGCMRKHNWGHDFIVFKAQVLSGVKSGGQV